jgi:glycosyltransferase involved in cell wall biosynthesis
MNNRSLLLIADAFYPREIPPECKTNTYLATALASRGWNVFVWAGDGARVPVCFEKNIVVRTTRFWGLAEAVKIFVWLVLHKPAQVILMYHSELYSNRPDINWVPIMARLSGVHLVTLFTSGVKPRRSPIQDNLLRLFGLGSLLKYPVGPLGASAKMIFYCDHSRHCLLGKDPLNLKALTEISTPPNTLTVNSPTNKSLARKSWVLSDQDFLIGYFGLLYSGKGIEYLVEAMAILKTKGIIAKLIVVGPHGGVTANESWNLHCQNYEVALKQKASDLAIADMIIWTGFCEESKAVQILACCDLICLPFDEGLTNLRSSFITCAQVGLPVITTLTSATDEFLQDSASGIMYIEPRNALQIAHSIASCYENREMTRKRGSMLKSFAARHYNNEHFVDCFDMS